MDEDRIAELERLLCALCDDLDQLEGSTFTISYQTLQFNREAARKALGQLPVGEDVVYFRGSAEC